MVQVPTETKSKLGSRDSLTNGAHGPVLIKENCTEASWRVSYPLLKQAMIDVDESATVIEVPTSRKLYPTQILSERTLKLYH